MVTIPGKIHSISSTNAIVDTYREFLLYAISNPIGGAAFSKIAIPDYDIYLRNVDVVNIDLESKFLNINVLIYEFPKPTNDIKPTIASVETSELFGIACRTYKKFPIFMRLPVQEKNYKLTAWDIQDSYRMKSKYSTDSFTCTAMTDITK